jgi:hypothetical protein
MSFLITDLLTAALVDDHGTIAWYTYPTFGSPAVFGAADGKPCGYYKIAAIGCTARSHSVAAGVVVTRYSSPNGIGELHDFMRVDGRQQLIRRATCLRGRVPFVLECEPRFDHGRDRHSVAVTRNGATFRSPLLSLTLHTRRPLRSTRAGVRAEFELTTGESATFALAEPSTGERPLAETAAQRLLAETITFWQSGSSCPTEPIGAEWAT